MGAENGNKHRVVLVRKIDLDFSSKNDITYVINVERETSVIGMGQTQTVWAPLMSDL